MCVYRTVFNYKLVFSILTIGLLLYTITFSIVYHSTVEATYRKYQVEYLPVPNTLESRLKYILMWTTVDKTENFGDGVFPFIDNRCSNTNCYLTINKNLLSDYTKFEAIIFNPKNMKDWKRKNLPSRRSTTQKYIFYSTLPPNDAPVCNVISDDYFNWTCTYKLDSDISSPMIEVLDLEGNYVAPKATVDWETTRIPLLDREIKLLQNKTKAMAWIVDRCVAHNERLTFARKLREAFKVVSLDFDIYGCGFLECPEGNCFKVLRNYYFYYAAEDSDSVDYVTKEVLKGYHTLSVPVVKGGADYKKFLPEGSYIDASSISIDKLVARIDYAIRNSLIYNNFHHWRKYYRIRAANPFQGLCKICKSLNNDEVFNRYSVKRNFRKWWNNSPLFERCLPKSAESVASVLSYANKSFQ